MFRGVTVVLTAIGVAIVLGCQPDYPNCKKDTHCHSGEYCVNNLCQQCRDNGDCPEGQECAAGGCRDRLGVGNQLPLPEQVDARLVAGDDVGSVVAVDIGDRELPADAGVVMDQVRLEADLPRVPV